MTLRSGIVVAGLVAAIAASAYWTDFNVRGPSVDDGNSSGGRLTRPIWDPPRPGEQVKFVRHSGLTDFVEVETATIDARHSMNVFAGVAIAFGLLAWLAGRRASTEKNL